jgi:hypothetical protein
MTSKPLSQAAASFVYLSASQLRVRECNMTYMMNLYKKAEFLGNRPNQKPLDTHTHRYSVLGLVDSMELRKVTSMSDVTNFDATAPSEIQIENLVHSCCIARSRTFSSEDCSFPSSFIVTLLKLNAGYIIDSKAETGVDMLESICKEIRASFEPDIHQTFLSTSASDIIVFSSRSEVTIPYRLRFLCVNGAYPFIYSTSFLAFTPNNYEGEEIRRLEVHFSFFGKPDINNLFNLVAASFADKNSVYSYAITGNDDFTISVEAPLKTLMRIIDSDLDAANPDSPIQKESNNLATHIRSMHSVFQYKVDEKDFRHPFMPETHKDICEAAWDDLMKLEKLARGRIPFNARFTLRNIMQTCLYLLSSPLRMASGLRIAQKLSYALQIIARNKVISALDVHKCLRDISYMLPIALLSDDVLIEASDMMELTSPYIKAVAAYEHFLQELFCILSRRVCPCENPGFIGSASCSGVSLFTIFGFSYNIHSTRYFRAPAGFADGQLLLSVVMPNTAMLSLENAYRLYIHEISHYIGVNLDRKERNTCFLKCVLRQLDVLNRKIHKLKHRHSGTHGQNDIYNDLENNKQLTDEEMFFDTVRHELDNNETMSLYLNAFVRKVSAALVKIAERPEYEQWREVLRHEDLRFRVLAETMKEVKPDAIMMAFTGKQANDYISFLYDHLYEDGYIADVLLDECILLRMSVILHWIESEENGNQCINDVFNHLLRNSPEQKCEFIRRLKNRYSTQAYILRPLVEYLTSCKISDNYPEWREKMEKNGISLDESIWNSNNTNSLSVEEELYFILNHWYKSIRCNKGIKIIT